MAVRHHYENVVNYILTARIKVSGMGRFFGGAAGTVGNALEQGSSRNGNTRIYRTGSEEYVRRSRSF
ncbi:MAG: hypothetical protein OSJ59_14870 [Lachnospiraceae bacterium]|nr:hypothetical protein [uncultured Acetatifactor sp.]MCX4324230.1 hypothetical protein [Lachnospiraceae bacterium]